MSRIVLLATVALIGCEAGPHAEAPIVSDSLGTVIVDHGQFDVLALPEWRLDGQPQTLVGVAEGSDDEILFGVLDAERLPDSSVVVVDRTRTVRGFGGNGGLKWAVGGRGDGPGEFQWPQKVLGMPGDSLVVWDTRQRRLTVVTKSGEVVRTATLPNVSGDTRALGLIDPTHLLLEVAATERAPVDGRPAATRSAQYIGVDLNGTPVSDLGRRVLSVQFREIDASGPYSPVIFSAPVVAAAAPGGVWLGDPRAGELRLFTASGVERIVRWDEADRAVTRSDLEAALRHWGDSVDADPEVAQYIREYGRTHPISDLFPLFDQVSTDRGGRLWVRQYVPDHWPEESVHWLVISRDGLEVLARLAHSHRFEPLRFGPNWVLGIERDSLDVQRLTMYGIVGQ